MYTKDFKEKAVIEYESGKSANQIFQKAEINILILLKRYDYASKIRRIKMDLEDIHGKIMNKKKISRIMKELNLRTKK